jgi:hypothetical protein
MWKTSFRGCKLRIGDIVTLNNARYNLTEQMVRLTEIKTVQELRDHGSEGPLPCGLLVPGFPWQRGRPGVGCIRAFGPGRLRASVVRRGAGRD